MASTLLRLDQFIVNLLNAFIPSTFPDSQSLSQKQLENQVSDLKNASISIYIHEQSMTLQNIEFADTT